MAEIQTQALWYQVRLCFIGSAEEVTNNSANGTRAGTLVPFPLVTKDHRKSVGKLHCDSIGLCNVTQSQIRAGSTAPEPKLLPARSRVQVRKLAIDTAFIDTEGCFGGTTRLLLTSGNVYVVVSFTVLLKRSLH